MVKMVKKATTEGTTESRVTAVANILLKTPDISVKQLAKTLKVKESYMYVLRSMARRKIKEAEAGGPTSQEMNPRPRDPVDNVNHPAHYKVGGIETIEFIEAKKLGYNLGNVVKYITRAEHKHDTYEDLCKARWYLNREIAKLSESRK